MTHSFSSLSKWRNCPRMFEAQYITKEFRDTGSEATRKGEIIHKELEEYVKGETAKAPVSAPADGLHDILRALKERGVPVDVEQELAVRQDLSPCGWWDKDAYLRGKLDVLVDLSEMVLGLDYKSGKRRNNIFQASTYAILIHAHHPGAEVQLYFDYLEKGRDKPIKPKWEEMAEVLHTAKTIDDSTIFPPKPSGLCRFCPVLTCEFNEK